MENKLSTQFNETKKECSCKPIKEVVWSVTGRCNYKCRHCSVSAPSYTGKDIPLEGCEKLIKEFVKCGIPNVTLIGGEPLVRSDFIELVQMLKNYGIRISQIFTNSSLITPELLQKLEMLAVRPIFRTSFDGVGVHDLQRGIHGAEAILLRKLKLLEEKNYNVVIDMCINSRNINVMPETLDLLNSFENVNLINITPTCDIGNWKNEADSEKLPDEFYYEHLLKFVPEYVHKKRRSALNIYRIIYIPPDKKPVLIPKNYLIYKYGLNACCCPSFEGSINISADGCVSPCYVISDSDFVKNDMPNINNSSLYDILTKSMYIKYAGTSADEIVNGNSECKSCNYRTVCGGGCRAMAVCEKSDFYGSDKSSCIFFKNGYYDKFTNLLLKMKQERVDQYGRNEERNS